VAFKPVEYDLCHDFSDISGLCSIVSSYGSITAVMGNIHSADVIIYTNGH